MNILKELIFMFFNISSNLMVKKYSTLNIYVYNMKTGSIYVYNMKIGSAMQILCEL